MNNNVNIIPYVVRFSITYIIAMAALVTLVVSLGLSRGFGGSMAALIAAASMAAYKFVQDHGRVPDAIDRRKLTFATLVVSLLVQALLLVIFLAPMLKGSDFNAYGGMEFYFIVVFGLLFVAVLHAVTLWFSYGWFARMSYQSLQGKE